VKAFLHLYNWMKDFIYHLTHYMVAAVCRSDNVEHFTKFIDIVADTDHPLQPWTGAPLVPTIVVMSLGIYPSPHAPL
jgi:hypothetical protein